MEDKKIIGGLGIGGLILILIVIIVVVSFAWIMEFI